MINKRNFEILSLIVENPGLKAIKLSRLLKVNCSSMLVSVQRFEKLGLIKRVKNGRAKPIFVTKKGKEIFFNLKILKDKWKL